MCAYACVYFFHSFLLKRSPTSAEEVFRFACPERDHHITNTNTLQKSTLHMTRAPLEDNKKQRHSKHNGRRRDE
jgi:hypothetical protein